MYILLMKNRKYYKLMERGKVLMHSENYFSKWNAKRAATKVAELNNLRLRVDETE